MECARRWEQERKSEPLPLAAELNGVNFVCGPNRGLPMVGTARPLTRQGVALEESCLSNDMRGKQPAEESGTLLGGKPVESRQRLRANQGDDWTPAELDAEARNLCLKRRDHDVVKIG